MTSTLRKFPRLNAPKLHTLSNGLTIVVEQMPVEAVNLSLWLNVGSAVETDAINGMAHFLEHMIFKGTERLASGEFERHIEERGAVTNAATSQDYTHYYINTAPQDFAKLAPLQIDVVLNASIPDEAFERERLVVLEEIRRSEDNPRRRTFRRAMEMAFTELPYRRPVLGPESVISQLTSQQMRDFHAKWYQPQSITAVAVGNLPEEELIEIIAEGFDQIHHKTPQSPVTPVRSTEGSFARDWLPSHASLLNEGSLRTRQAPQSRQFAQRREALHATGSPIPEPGFTEIVRQEFVDESLQQARLVMLWRVPGLNYLEQTYALDVLASILGHGRTSRLVYDLREERGLVTSISVSNMSNRLQGTFYISAKCAVEDVQVVEDAIAQHIRKLQTELVTEKEIARVRKRVTNRYIFGNETPSDRAGLYGFYQSLVGDLEPAFNYPAHIQAQEATDLLLAANQYLCPEAYGVVVLKPA